jgi:hypothetical protein
MAESKWWSTARTAVEFCAWEETSDRHEPSEDEPLPAAASIELPRYGLEYFADAWNFR